MKSTNSKTFYYINLLILLILLILNINTSIVNAKSLIKIVVDPGHGGFDPGVVYNGVIEKNVSLDISNRLEHYLGESIYNIIITRKNDNSLYKLSKKGNTFERRDLNARVNIINNSSAILFTSIHVNSYIFNTHCTGSIVYYYSKSIKSKALAYSIQNSLNNIVINNQKRKHNKPIPANFYILRKTKMSGVLIETAFITNKSERKLLKSKKFKNTIALAITNGIKNYLSKNININLTKPTRKVVHSHKKNKSSKQS